MALPWMVRSPPPVRVTLPPRMTVPVVWLALSVRFPWPPRLPDTVRLPVVAEMLDVLLGPEPKESPVRVNAWLLVT